MYTSNFNNRTMLSFGIYLVKLKGGCLTERVIEWKSRFEYLPYWINELWRLRIIVGLLF